MRLDTEMLTSVSAIGFRIYRWSEVCITIGRNQTRDDATDDPEVPVIKRPTGGSAVLHGHDLTVSIAATLDSLNCKERDVRSVYRALVSPLIQTLIHCGVEADYGSSGMHRDTASSYCFAMRSPYDIVNLMTGNKVCGCAMRVMRDRALIQASIPIQEPNEIATQFIKNYVAIPTAKIDSEAFANYFLSIMPTSTCWPPRTELQ